MFGWSPWVELPVWIAVNLILSIAIVVRAAAKGRYDFKPAVGLFYGAALGPLAIAPALLPRNRGDRTAVILGGCVGTMVMMKILALL